MNSRDNSISPDGEQDILALVINLDRHQNRIEWFMRNAAQKKLRVERIQAIDARDPDALVVLEAMRAPGANLSLPELACIASHRKAWERLLDSGDSHIAVFEDDAHLSDDIARLLQSALIPEGVELVKLEVPSGKVSFSKKAHAPFLGRHLHLLYTNACGGGGYILSRKCAERLLAISAVCANPVDGILFDADFPPRDGFPVYQVIPAACIQDAILQKARDQPSDFESAIEGGRQECKAERSKKRKKKIRGPSIGKLRRYVHCVLQGADPFNYRSYVPYDLGAPRPRQEKRAG